MQNKGSLYNFNEYNNDVRIVLFIIFYVLTVPILYGYVCIHYMCDYIYTHDARAAWQDLRRSQTRVGSGKRWSHISQRGKLVVFGYFPTLTRVWLVHNWA